MSKAKKKKFNRPTATREYRKIFTIFPEGEKTENCYFTVLKELNKAINIIIKKGDKKTEPKQILSRAKKYIRENGLSKNEEVWLVIDVDNRPEESFRECYYWENENKKYNLAISNPKFEYWLLMHFENGNNIEGPNDCMKKLMKHLPSYTKSNISSKEITKENCKVAVTHGKQKHQDDQTIKDNYSTVYKLVEKILETQ